MFDGELAERRCQLQVADAPCAPVAGHLAFQVQAVCRSATHSFAKTPDRSIRLLSGLGVEGDAHCGATDQHLFRRRADAPPNLRQLHLFSGEVMDEMIARGFAIEPGAVGENVMTRGVALLDLPLDTLITFPSGAVVRLTGRRTPCRLLDRIAPGLMKALAGEKGGRWGENAIAGVMAVIVSGGDVCAGDRAQVALPPLPHRALPPL